MTYTEFLRRFPDDDACLAHLKDKFYADGTACPKCGKASRFHRIKGRSAYSCQFCGTHVYPTADTIFHKSTTSLQLWFWAIYLISSSKCGISAKQLGREIGVTYKTAHRMLKMIRTLLAEDVGPLSGDVEVDETFMSGRMRNSDRRKRDQAGVQDDAGTQNVESFFALFTNSVRGAHHSISARYLDRYLDEYMFRWNHRKDEALIFWMILDRARKRPGLGAA